MLGKTVSDLQTGVEVGDGAITGTLKHVTGYTGFSGVEGEQSGNYLVLKVATSLSNAVNTVELVGGTVGHPVTLDSDMNIVLRITNKATQKVKVVTTKSGESATKIFSLTGLTLETP